MLFILYRILQLLLIKLPLQLIGIPVAAIILLFKLRDKRVGSNALYDQRLPKMFRWFDVGDVRDKGYGINGDLGYQTKQLLGSEEVLMSCQLQDAISINPPSIWKIYWMRLNWLALRNPINYFQYNVLGIRSVNLGRLIKVIDRSDNFNLERDDYSKSPEIGDWPGHVAGFRYREFENAKEYYWIYRYPFLKSRCFRARIGHKLGHTYPYRAVIQWVCTIQPFKSYRGK